MNELEKVKAERDALAAHVERLQSAVRAAETPSGVVHVCETWMVDTHQSSLARLKAQWQAEVLEKMLGVNDAGIEKKMMELRRQAEENDND